MRPVQGDCFVACKPQISTLTLSAIYSPQHAPRNDELGQKFIIYLPLTLHWQL
jgi:hypothetical protein